MVFGAKKNARIFPDPRSETQRFCMMRAKARTNSSFVFGLRQTNWAATLLPLATLFHELDAFKTLEDGTLATHCGS